MKKLTKKELITSSNTKKCKLMKAIIQGKLKYEDQENELEGQINVFELEAG